MTANPPGSVSGQPIGERLLLENDRVRVWMDVVAPGAEQPVHTHRTAYLSVMLTDAHAQVVGADGEVRYDVDRAEGTATWFGPERVPVTHTLRNLGTSEVRVLIVEVLDAASDAATSGDQPRDQP
jgi:hypothetical protein